MDFSKLLTELDKLSTTKNRIPYNEFIDYSQLYQKDNSQLSDSELKNLSERFLSRIDPYENIEVVDSNGNVIVTLPRINNPTRAIDKKFEHAKAAFRNQSSSDVPKHRVDAVKGIVDSFRASAKDPQYVEAVEGRINEFRELDKQFTDKKSHPVNSTKIETEVEDALTPSIKSEFDWEIV